MSKVIVLFSDNETVPYDDCDRASVGPAGELLVTGPGEAYGSIIAPGFWKLCDIHTGDD